VSNALLLLLALGFGLAGWLAARAKAWSFRGSGNPRLAALPSYHGWYLALWVAVPMVLFVAVWGALAPGLVTQSVLAESAAPEFPAIGFQRQAVLSEVHVDALGNAYVTGYTSSSNFPTTAGVFQPTYGGGGDALKASFVERPGRGFVGRALLHLHKGDDIAALGDQVDFAAGRSDPFRQDAPTL